MSRERKSTSARKPQTRSDMLDDEDTPQPTTLHNDEDSIDAEDAHQAILEAEQHGVTSWDDLKREFGL